MSEQVNIFGQVHAQPEPRYAAIPPLEVEQPRLFEPQMEGQLTLGEDEDA
jgi:hypothetical protein